jgi:MinD-like ATPase involved in chromosome partitioning or flagellar assembly
MCPYGRELHRVSSPGKSDRDPVRGEGVTAPLPPQDSGQQTDSAARKPLSSGASEAHSDAQRDNAPAQPGRATSAGAALTMHRQHGTRVPPKPDRPPTGDPQSSPDNRPPDARSPSNISDTAAPPATARAGQASRTNAEAASWELTTEELRAAEVITEHKVPAAKGWRKWLRVATFGLVAMEQSPDERRVRALNAIINSPLRGAYSVVVLGGKGGVGKTIAAIGMGSMFALVRKDKVVAIDGNPDIGANLAERIDPTAASSYREVLADDRIERYADMRSHVGQSPVSGLDVLAANRQVNDRKLLDPKTYHAAYERLQRFYSVFVTDAGTNVEHPVMKGLLAKADSIIVVASSTRDSAQAAGKVMDWLRESGHHELLARSVVVLNDVTGRSDGKLIDTLVKTFARRVGDGRVFVLPYDRHIAAAGVVDIDQLRPATRRRFLEIAAAVAANFPATPNPPDRRPR